MVDRGGVALPRVRVGGGPAGTLRTDVDGRLVLEGVPDGRWTLRLIEPGIVFGSVDVRIENGSAVSATLREGPSFDVTVFVTDEAGAPARFARVSVSPLRGAQWVHLVDGVQTLTVTTDENGLCMLPNLPWVNVRVRVSFGTRSTSAFVGPSVERVSLQLGRDIAVALR